MAKISKKHFVFDVDDTLTDAYEFNQQIFVDEFEKYIDIKNPKIDKYLRDLHSVSRGKSMVDQFKEAIEYFNLNLDPEKLASDNENLQIEKSDQIKVFEAVKDVIKHLKSSGRDISVCSNRRIGSLQKILKRHNLTKYISNIISCAESGHEKPDPYCLLKLVKESGLHKDNFIYFGDSKTDYEFASSAGIDFVIIDHYLNQKKFYKMMLLSFV